MREAPDADILVNNVGTGRPKSFFEIEDSEWIGLFELNVMSGIRASRHYVPNMTKRGWGRVVFISSESALAVPKDMIDYAMTKTAQLAISRGLAEEVGGTGVTVNSVLPGPTNSEIMGGWAQANAEAQGITREEAEQQFLKTMRPTTLLNRFATTEEVANLVVYVCSEQASATTGTSLRVDGGVVRTIACRRRPLSAHDAAPRRGQGLSVPSRGRLQLNPSAPAFAWVFPLQKATRRIS